MTCGVPFLDGVIPACNFLIYRSFLGVQSVVVVVVFAFFGFGCGSGLWDFGITRLSRGRGGMAVPFCFVLSELPPSASNIRRHSSTLGMAS